MSNFQDFSSVILWMSLWEVKNTNTAVAIQSPQKQAELVRDLYGSEG